MQKFKGVYTALITPFTTNDHLDEEGLSLLINRQMEAHVDGIVVLGSTGEAPTLTQQEKRRTVRIAKEACLQKTSLIVGTGSYATKQAIENTLEAESAGADAALIVAPYYNKPTQEGLYRHFKAIAEATRLPIILYNHPGRTAANLQIETLQRLIEIPSIVGIKEATGSIPQINDVLALVKRARPEFSVLSGDDAMTLPVMALGGDGVISVLSNLVPHEIKNLVTAIEKGAFNQARELHFNLMPLFHAAFIETNPIPIKAMHELQGLPAGKCRSPLCEMSPDNAYELREILKKWKSIDVDEALNVRDAKLALPRDCAQVR